MRVIQNAHPSKRIPEAIAVLANDIYRVSRWRYLHQKDRNSKLFYLKNTMPEHTYE
jgi:hypothetical protein